MATKKRKKQNRSGVGTAIYVVLLTLWILFLAAVCLYILSQMWAYASVYDDTQKEPVIEAYMNKLRENVWDDNIAATVAAMPHPVQTDEEVGALVKDMLLNDELSYAEKPGFTRGDSITYNLLCGENIFGEVTLREDTSKNLVKDVDLPDVVIGALAKMGVAIQPELYPWKVTEERFDFSGLYSSVRATVPENYKVTLNGVTLDEGYIVERDIPFDILEGYYYRYDNLPTKVTYQFDNLMGHIDPVIYDANGELTVINKEADDGQFLKPVDDEETRNRLAEHLNGFSDAYLCLSASTGDPTTAYANLANYIEAGSELDNKLRQVFLIGDWSHNSYYQYQGFELLNAWQLDQNCYVAEYRASATVNQPAGPVALDRTFRSIVDASGDHMITATIDDI
jgi:hypothetical protein